MVNLIKIDAECRAYLTNRSGEPNAPPCLTGLDDSQVIGVGEGHNLGDIRGRSSMDSLELVAREVLALSRRSSGCRL